MKNYKAYRKKRWWPILKHKLGIILEGLREIMESSIKITSHDLNHEPPKYKQKL